MAKEDDEFQQLVCDGNTERVEYLLSNYTIDINRFSGNTYALFEAIRKGYTDIAKLLINHKDIDLNIKGAYTDYNALFCAIINNNLEIAKLLLSKGMDVNETTKSGETPLHLAAFFEHRDMIELLLDSGANKSAKDIEGNSAEDIARRENNFELADYIRDYEYINMTKGSIDPFYDDLE